MLSGNLSQFESVGSQWGKSGPTGTAIFSGVVVFFRRRGVFDAVADLGLVVAFCFLAREFWLGIFMVGDCSTGRGPISSFFPRESRPAVFHSLNQKNGAKPQADG